MDNSQDPNLQAPQEANTTKHINFLAAEEDALNSDAAEKEPFKEDDSPTKKEWEEMRKGLKDDDSFKEEV